MRYLLDVRHVASAPLREREREDVLLTVADPRAANTETREPGAVADPRHVYGALPNRLLPGAQALHHLQPGVPRRGLPHLLQRQRQLPAVEHKLRHSKMRQWLKSRSVFTVDSRITRYLLPLSLVVTFFPLSFIFLPPCFGAV